MEEENVVTLLKPSKNLINSKSYRPISLLCQAYKLYEKLILNRIKTQIAQQIIPEQAGFRPGSVPNPKLLSTYRRRL